MPVLPFMRSDVVRSAGPKTTSATSLTRVFAIDLDGADRFGRLGARIGAHEQGLVGVGHAPRRRIEGDVAEGRHQVADGQVTRRQGIGIDDDPDERIAVAVDLDVGDALDGGEAVDRRGP